MGPDVPVGGADLERFRSYLRLLARTGLGRRLQSKLDASDLVQQTLLEAHQDLGQFRGQGEAALAAWLRQVLARNLANAARDLGRQKRDAARELSLEDSAARLEGWLAAEQLSPSRGAVRHENAVQLAQALEALPANQRDAVVLRHLEGLSLADIAARLGCTTAAVTGLLHRGLKNLRQRLPAPE
jgi:RNA polymerase sigma-70 factor (ECF subfamily)